ncbi:MAG: hypothetical protein QM756_42825 [Polyangiaceae bacterium]
MMNGTKFVLVSLGVLLCGSWSCSNSDTQTNSDLHGGQTSSGGKSSSGGSGGASAGSGDEPQAGAAPYDCVVNPKTHLEIINACTDSLRVEKAVSLPPLPQ